MHQTEPVVLRGGCHASEVRQLHGPHQSGKAGARIRILQREAGSGMPTTGVLLTGTIPVNENTKKLVPEFRALFD